MATYYDLNGQPYTPPAPTGPAPGRGMPAPTPSGSNGLLGYAEAPIAGALGTAANVVQAGQAGAKAVGLDSAAAKAASWAGYLRQAGAGFQSPELEQNARDHPWTPSNIGYQVLKGAPGALATLGGAVLAPEVVGPALGGAIAAYPQMVGSNVEANEAAHGPLTQDQAAQSLVWAVPEAAIGGWSGGKAAAILSGAGKKAASSLGEKAAAAAGAGVAQAGVGAVASAGQNFIAQQMVDPNRPIAKRMNEMISAALTGGATGALMGAGLHALAKANPNDTPNEAINAAVGQGLGIEPPPSIENATQGELPLPPSVNKDRPYQGTPQGRLDQLSAYFNGIASPDMFQQHQAGLVEAEQSLRAAAPRPGTRGNPVLPGDVTPVDTGTPQPTLWDQGQIVPPARPLAEVNDLPQSPAAEDFETEQGPEPAIMFSSQQLGKPLFKAMDHTNADTQRATFYERGITPAQRVGDAPLRRAQEVAATALGLKVDDHKLIPETAPNAPSRDSIEPVNRPVYDQAENLREAVKDEPAVTEALDKVQSKPSSPDAPAILKTVEDHVANKQVLPNEPASLPPEPVTGPSEAATAQTPVNTKPVLDAITKAKDSLALLKKLKTGKDNLVGVDQGYQQALDAQNAKLDQLAEAVNDGGPKAREALASVGTKPFAIQQVFNDYGGNFSDVARTLMRNHLGKEQAVLNGIAKAYPSDVLHAVPTEDRPVTQQMVDLAHIADNGGTLQHGLAYLATNGETGAIKTVARHLMGRGVDGPLSMVDVVSNDDGSPNAQGAASYRISTNKTELVRGYADGQDLIHEAVHAATAKAIEAGGPAAKDMTRLYDTVKESSPNKDAYGLTSVHEFTAEAFTNPSFQADLRSLPADSSLPGAPKTLWQAFKNAVGKAIGMDTGGKRTMLDQVLETGGRLMDENAAAPQASDNPLYTTKTTKTAAGTMTVTTETLNDRVKQTIGMADNIFARAGVFLSKASLSARSPSRIVEAFSNHIPAMKDWAQAREDESNQKSTWAKTLGAAHNLFRALSEPEKAQHDAIRTAAAYNIDPRKPRSQQDPELQKLSNWFDIAKISDDAYRAWVGTSQDVRDAVQARFDVDQTTNLAKFSMYMHDIVNKSYPGIQGFEDNHARAFQVSAEAHDKPALAKAEWLGEITKKQAGMTAEIDAEKAKVGTPGLTDDQTAALRKQLKTAANMKNLKDDSMPPEKAVAKATLASLDKIDMLQRWVDGSNRIIKSLDGVPYVHLGHGEGDWFAHGRIALDDKGLPSQPAINAIMAAAKKEGFGDIAINRGLDNNKMYMKFDTPEKAQRAGDMFRALQAEGHLTDDPVSSGPAEQAVRHGVGLAAMHDFIAALEKSIPERPEGMDDKTYNMMLDAHKRAVNDATRDMLDMAGMSSPTRINAKRNDVQAFTTKMAEAARSHDAAVAGLLGRIGNAEAKGKSFSDMRDQMRAVNASDLPGAQKDAAHNAINELMLREARQPTTPPNGFVKAVTWISRASEIGFNPAYAVTMHSQDWTYTLPELGKTHGMANAARAIAGAEVPSIKLMRAMIKGNPDWAFAGMRRSDLIANGISEKDADFHVEIDNRGGYTHSAFTNSLVNEEGEGLRAQIANISTSMGRYLEAQQRMKIALAARTLWRGETKDGPLIDFALGKIKSGAWDYSTADTARQQTRSGMFGQLSPLINQFMAYRTKATEKLYQEFHDLFSPKGSTPEETAANRVQAGKFLAAHLAATTVLAGACGLPMVAVFASVYDKLADTLTGSPNHDIMGSFRHFLTHTYGPVVGTALARGASTAIGVDLSHLGEEDIAPGSNMIMMLTEKRKFEDAEKDWLKELAGTSVGMLGKWVVGARDMANGDYLNGAINMVPEAFKGPLEALRDDLRGFRASKAGTPSGITPTGVELAMEAIGLDPAREETLKLNQDVLNGLEQRRTDRSAFIMQHLAKAQQTGDHAGFQRWMGEAARYTQDYPGMPSPLAHFDPYLSKQYEMAAVGRSMNMPPVMPRVANYARQLGMFGP